MHSPDPPFWLTTISGRGFARHPLQTRSPLRHGSVMALRKMLSRGKIDFISFHRPRFSLPPPANKNGAPRLLFERNPGIVTILVGVTVTYSRRAAIRNPDSAPADRQPLAPPHKIGPRVLWTATMASPHKARCSPHHGKMISGANLPCRRFTSGTTMYRRSETMSTAATQAVATLSLEGTPWSGRPSRRAGIEDERLF